MNLSQNILVVGAQKVGLVEGLSTFVVGMGVVFLALILLVILLEISGSFFATLDKNQVAKKQGTQVVAPEVVAPAIVETTQTDDLELIAVITATLAATMGTSADNLQVRSLRKTNNAWKMSGRSEQLYN